MHFCLFFSFLIFVIATCSFLIWTLLGRKNWWDVMIYIYFRFRRAEEEARLAAQRSEEQQRQAEKRRQLQASNIPTIFSWKNGPPKPLFFWSFLLRKKLNNHGKSYVTFLNHNQQQLRGFLFFNKSTNLVLVGLCLKVFGFQGDGDEGSRICRRGGPLDTCFPFLLIMAL